MKLSQLTRALLACLAGTLVPLSLSPIDLWPLAILSVAALLLLLQSIDSKQSAWIGWSYGFGFFGAGVSWIYVSMSTYGETSAFFAGPLTLIFVASLSLLFSLQCWLYQRFFNKTLLTLGFAALWVMFEWLRSWLFTGFPWLYLGYAHINTPLAGIAPVFGVMGSSLAIALSGTILTYLFTIYRTNPKQLKPALLKGASVLLLTWGTATFLQTINWVEEVDSKDISVGLVQANIPQRQKFKRSFLDENLKAYELLSEPLWQHDIVIWPETAVPLLYQQASEVLSAYAHTALTNNSTLVTGVFFREGKKTYNSITSLGNGAGIYHKRRMVPFGEYTPLAGVLELFNLPMASLHRGPARQGLLSAADLHLAPFICYDVVYPELVRQSAYKADFLVTISNEIWFGNSLEPRQHLQMAAMRALENGRYMVKATNNGISAIIDEKGKILSNTQQFQTTVLGGKVKVFKGRTPFSRWGSYPVLLFSSLILLYCFIRQGPFIRPLRKPHP